MAPPRSDLHVHLSGTVTADQALAIIARRAVDWSAYEDAYDLAFGHWPELRPLLARFRAGDDTIASQFRRLYTFSADDGPGFERFQAKADLFGWGSPLADPQLQRHLTQDAAGEIDRQVVDWAERCRQTGIGHSELRMELPAHRPPQVCRALVERALRACLHQSDGATRLDLLLGMPRARAVEHVALVEELAQGPLGGHFVGIDVCQRERNHPPADMGRCAEALHAFNRRRPERALALCYHVGEETTGLSWESAIRWVVEAAELGAHRLGHALPLARNPTELGREETWETVAERRRHLDWEDRHAPSLAAAGLARAAVEIDTERQHLAGLDDQARVHHGADASRPARLAALQQWAIGRIRALGTVIECCPSSNARIGGCAGPDHPLARLEAAGVPWVVGSDDPGLLDSEPDREWALALAWSGAEEDALRQRAWACRARMLSGRQQAESGCSPGGQTAAS